MKAAAAFAIIAVVAVITILLDCIQIHSLESELLITRKHIVELEQQVRVLEGDVKRHDDIMTTYQFFNEKWTDQMKGER